MNTPENPHRARMALLLAGVLSAWPAFAQTTYYWDGNGTTAGAGATASNNGNWGGASASAFWGTVANGTGATTAFGSNPLWVGTHLVGSGRPTWSN